MLHDEVDLGLAGLVLAMPVVQRVVVERRARLLQLVCDEHLGELAPVDELRGLVVDPIREIESGLVEVEPGIEQHELVVLRVDVAAEGDAVRMGAVDAHDDLRPLHELGAFLGLGVGQLEFGIGIGELPAGLLDDGTEGGAENGGIDTSLVLGEVLLEVLHNVPLFVSSREVALGLRIGEDGGRHAADDEEGLEVVEHLAVGEVGKVAGLGEVERPLIAYSAAERDDEFREGERVDEDVANATDRDVADFREGELEERSGGDDMQGLDLFVEIPEGCDGPGASLDLVEEE